MSRKNMAKEQSAKKPFVDNLDLPVSYNRTKLILIARDPHWIYAYWEIAQSSIEEIRAQAGAEADRGVYTLRMYDVSCIDFNGSNANRQFDIDVGSNANNWYVNIWNDSASFCAELGLRLPDGRFLKIARSNFVTVPRANPSGRSEQIWMKKEDDSPQRPYVFGQVQKKTNNSPAGRNHRANSRRMSLTEDDVRAYYSRLSPRLKDIISARLSRAKKPVNVVLKESGRLTDKFTKRMMIGSSEETAIGASEQNVRARKFFFELDTELMVYGRTEPDAKVMLGGKRITLRSDGTFSLRFILPDGKIPLLFKATSADNVKKREISTGVEREKTLYA